MKKLLLSISFFAVGFVTYAQDSTPRFERRNAEQRERIREGRKSGQLTRRETARLNAQQRHIHREEHRAMANGRISRHEKQRLNRDQYRASRNIRRQRHDGQNRNFQ